MKKKLTILLAIALTMLSGCKHTSDYKQSEMQMITDTGMHHIGEWTSPDGVHYWMYSDDYCRGLTPRYDNKGNLVIESNY